MAKHNEIGKIGEDIAANFLKKNGLKIIERNYRKPYGEIDIVACETNLIRFVEVKSVSYIPTDRQEKQDKSVSRGIRPEENLHPQKIRRLARVIETYIVSHETGEWAFDLLCVYINQKDHTAKVKWIKDIILS